MLLPLLLLPLVCRGVHEFEVLVDDFLIYRGVLQQAPAQSSHVLADQRQLQHSGRRGSGRQSRRGRDQGTSAPSEAMTAPDFAQTILFTNDVAVCQREQKHIFIPEAEDHCLFINENTVVASPGQADMLLRPTTSTGSHRQGGVLR